MGTMARVHTSSTMEEAAFHRGSLELVQEGACTGDLHVEDGRVGAAVHVEADELPQLLIGDAALVRQEGPARRHHSPTRALRRDDVELVGAPQQAVH